MNDMTKKLERTVLKEQHELVNSEETHANCHRQSETPSVTAVHRTSTREESIFLTTFVLRSTYFEEIMAAPQIDQWNPDQGIMPTPEEQQREENASDQLSQQVCLELLFL